VRVNTFIAIGAIFAIVGLLGLTYIFPKMMCISGQDFVDQIDTSSGSEKYDDYSIGDTVTIYDSIARIEFSNGRTLVWLETIGKTANDPAFPFSSNIMGDYGVGNGIIIMFEVVQEDDGDYTMEGYENEGLGLSSDSISSRYSTTNEYIFMILVLGGIGSIIYGGYTSFIGEDFEDSDDWGFPAQAPPQAPMAAQPPPPQLQPPNPPSMAAVPSGSESFSPDVPQMNSDVTGMSFSASQSTSMTITVPPGVISGQVLTVTLPDGRAVNVQVPAGCNAGSQFTITVE
jgi:hypothetical protein